MDNWEEKGLPSFTREISGSKLKALVKRIIRKATDWILVPYEVRQNEINREVYEELQRLRQEDQICFQKMEEEYKAMIGTLARELVAVKWREIDRRTRECESPEDIIECKICGHKERRGNLKTMVSECQFNGGKLVRYVCPECGVIFGPTKFSALSQKEIDEDYIIHYYGFDETDLTWKEEEAFFMLNPDKNKMYLDYGCGRWSKTVNKLREMGYQVYGYEPYAPESENPYIITSWDTLRQYRFDGIFSNDLLEHLTDPVESLKQMKTLLKDPRGKMSHCTSCYVYRYEITRFHTHFFTGNSVKIMAERAGLCIEDCRDELEKRDFFCYVYGLADSEVKYMADVYVSESGERFDDRIVLHKGGLMCGPYIKLSSGEYRLKVVVDSDSDELPEISITSRSGQNVIKNVLLKRGDNSIGFSLYDIEDKVEFVIRNDREADLNIYDIALI